MLTNLIFLFIKIWRKSDEDAVHWSRLIEMLVWVPPVGARCRCYGAISSAASSSFDGNMESTWTEQGKGC